MFATYLLNHYCQVFHPVVEDFEARIRWVGPAWESYLTASELLARINLLDVAVHEHGFDPSNEDGWHPEPLPWPARPEEETEVPF